MGAFHSSGRNGAKGTASNGSAAKDAARDGAAKSNGIKPVAPFSGVWEDRLRRIMQRIESSPPRKIRDLALQCNLSQSHLQHVFKQGAGIGLGRLLLEYRMQRASEFLAHTNMSVKEIAFAVGYEHTSSFSRAFERHFNQAPRCYREAQVTMQLLKLNQAG
jgi:transcriptional regulator GlxA family with amidase domain